jgi:hypothetical protein
VIPGEAPIRGVPLAMRLFVPTSDMAGWTTDCALLRDPTLVARLDYGS